MGHLWAFARKLGGERGAVGPIGAYVYGLLILLAVVGITAGATVIGGVIRDQAAYANVLDAGAAKGGQDVGVRALASGSGQIQAADAQFAFSAYLTDPLEGDLTQGAPGSYTPDPGSQGGADGPTVQSLSISGDGLTVSGDGTQASAAGTASGVIPAPFIGEVQDSLPESTTVETTAAFGSIGKSG